MNIYIFQFNFMPKIKFFEKAIIEMVEKNEETT